MKFKVCLIAILGLSIWFEWTQARNVASQAVAAENNVYRQEDDDLDFGSEDDSDDSLQTSTLASDSDDPETLPLTLPSATESPSTDSRSDPSADDSALPLNGEKNDRSGAKNTESSLGASLLKRGSSLFSSSKKTNDSLNVEKASSVSGLGIPSDGFVPDFLNDPSVDEAIPDGALLILKTAPLNVLDKTGKYWLSQVGFIGFSPTALLKWSPFGKTIDSLDFDRPAAVAYYFDPSGSNLNGTESSRISSGQISASTQVFADRLVRVLVLPTKEPARLLQSLGMGFSEKGEQSGDVLASASGKYFAYRKDGFVVLVASPSYDFASRLCRSASIAAATRFPKLEPGVLHSQLNVVVTPQGIRYFSDLGNVALNDFAPLFQSTLRALESSDAQKTTEFGLNLKSGFKAKSDFDWSDAEYFQKATQGVQWVRQNVESFRADLVVRKKATVVSFAVVPRSNSELERQINDSFVPEMSTRLDLNRFLKVLPELPSALSGQIDVAENVAAKFDAPFNRLRHLEYSLATPGQNELLAETWGFFLEVDDSEQFVKELIVPKAKLIGGNIGAETAGELGAQFLGNMAVRRQNRQFNRNRVPRRPADPQGAAERGERIGSLLGGLIGQSAGEKEAMKKYDFEGYPLYISDLELYDREMRRIRAKEQGEVPPKPIFLTGEPTLLNVLGNLLSGIENGNLEASSRIALNRFASNSTTNGQETPLLLARNNYILVLDSRRLLIVPGNESLLREAKNNWERIRPYFISSDETNNAELQQNWNRSNFGGVYSDWNQLWDEICWEIPDATNHLLRSATRFDLVELQKLCDYIRRYYAPELPGVFAESLPSTTPATLTITTTRQNVGYVYWTFSHLTTKNIILKLLIKPKTE